MMATRARGINSAHTAGIFADMSLDGPEIGTLVAVVDRAKNLPNRKTMGKQDPYCAMRLGKEAKKTDTDKRGGQTPRWDQELRFTVHESPDYYKLKCSIFNDDKKTDLIGEAWIDLHDVILPGGGQSDQWRQLNFKGKYAGDIRVELTYYDTRPKPEVSPERRSQRDKQSSDASETRGSASGARQLGPREIKRRPLPPGPGGYSSPASVPSAAHTPERWPSEGSPDVWPGHGYTNNNPPPRPPKQKFIPETPDDVGYELNPRFGPDSYDSPYDSNPPQHQRHSSNDFYPHHENEPANYEDSDPFDMQMYQTRPLPIQPSHSHPSVGSSRSSVGPSTPPRSSQNASRHSPYHSSPSARTPPQSLPHLQGQNPLWQPAASTSPTKHAVYRDSPLRQSISHLDMPQPFENHRDPRFEEDEPPPPPPVHRGHMSRTSVGSVPHQDPHARPSPRTPVKHTSVEDRSPLQRLEQEYDPFQASPPPQSETRRQPPPPQPVVLSSSGDHGDRYPVFPNPRRQSFNDQAMQLQVSSSPDNVLSPESVDRQRHGDQPVDFRHSTGYGPPRRAQTFDTIDTHDERQIRRSDPIIVRPRAISPSANPNHSIPRKSITPSPSTPEHPRQMASTPYGPDSYESLNPGTSPATDDGSYAFSEAGKSTTRQNGGDTAVDHGPIIGNDGRVIDPSDHLPADTWAPEPERKNRQPEHVIRIRTREEARFQSRTGSSPVSTRPHSIATSPYQPPPALGTSPFQGSPAQISSPISPTTESPAAGRNRLKKAMPTRPLPTQPYPHAQTSPAVMTTSSPDIRAEPPRSHRNSFHSSPTGGAPPSRPSLSEYQIPPVNNYSPRGVAPGPYQRPEYNPGPAKSSHPLDYGSSPYRGDDPLALELSTIDIGPSRMGRTALRPQKGYGAY